MSNSEDATPSGEDEQLNRLESVLVEQPRDKTVANVLGRLIEIPEKGACAEPSYDYDSLSSRQQAIALALGQYAAWRLNRIQDDSPPRPNALSIEYLSSQTGLTEDEIRADSLLDVGVGSRYVTLDMSLSSEAIKCLRRRNCADANDDRTLSERINEEMVVSREVSDAE